jgi:hypothetical protein
VQEAKQERQMAKDMEKVEKLVERVENDKRKTKNKMAREEKERKQERDLQEKVGLIRKPKVLGRFKYKMRKDDFQMEEDLAENLRKMKPLGND